ncbi:hypothetical protein H6G54_16900 [Anabaena cylindrica FACHB-243]|uniref:Uncharacterized protein n=1 Tax=Anabaena cylindrica (strain ATCC 27899 / PCC 7122) TaxID=272123 RepID=K9ZGS3_ANACC|nr:MULTISPECIES: hypothetical protein [Anabaena]AFZ57742.1 hypothetical protein Anacy_2286 [Anabaena cylindrica PCC 7122]AZL96643.1 hypothetical protein [Anabaena sp. CCAP 1446/1C]MBD2419348.1 hypothetical protein [Anabaena cylindrica FACHB-243]MBY5282146.1 hypothetical protein [Anabaena sp. CCAP 1446/1C]MBY5307661.1 hypothetical protein [Anabaena sp. CCAP 1446/1C]
MKSRFLPYSLAAFVLFSGYTITQTVLANEPLIIAQSIWKIFSSPEGNFSILMPGKPTETKQKINTKNGIVEVNVFTVERPQDDVKYTVAYIDYPDDYIELLKRNNLVEEAINTGKKTALQNSKSTLISEEKISLGRYSGREVNYTKPGDLIVKQRIFLVDKRLYQVSVETSKNKQKYLVKSISGFCDSFNLLPK